MDSLAQIHEDEDLSAISEPDIDLDAVEVPEEGPLCFEFDLEVRPQFDLPKWKGLKLQKPVHEFTAEDIEGALQRLLANRGRLAPYDGPAEPGDYVSANLRFEHDGRVLASAAEETIRIRPTLSFRDGKIEGFDKLMAGVRAGETRRTEAQLSDDAPNAALQGQRVAAVFEVLEVKRLERPELDRRVARRAGRLPARSRPPRRHPATPCSGDWSTSSGSAPANRSPRALTVAAAWDLPPGLLQRQSQRELQRAVMELQRSGFSEDEIRAHENVLRQNSRAGTAQALKEHFILERIAEDQEIDADDADYEAEIKLIAAQSGESPRRVRAKLEKGGSMDVLRNQVIERKVIDLILENAEFEEVPYQPEASDVEALDLAAGGGGRRHSRRQARRRRAGPGAARHASRQGITGARSQELEARS